MRFSKAFFLLTLSVLLGSFTFTSRANIVRSDIQNFTANITTVRTSSGTDIEPNDTGGAPHDFGNYSVVIREPNQSIHVANNDDFFTVTFPQAGPAAVLIEFTHASGNLDLSIVDAAGTAIVSSESTEDSETLTRPVTAGEVLRIRVFGFQGATGNYTLSIISQPGAEPGIMAYQGHIEGAANAPAQGAIRLTEAAYGQPFSSWSPGGSTNSGTTYAGEIAAQVKAELYPPPNSTASAASLSGAAFRYKTLLFSPEPGESDVTSHFDNMDTWYGKPERDKANAQIAVLQEALAASPLDVELRGLLLDAYYDLAVAEMQFTNKTLAALAKKRLGLEIQSPFIIDEEIALYEELVVNDTNESPDIPNDGGIIGKVLKKYGELLTMQVDGFEPTDFYLWDDGAGQPAWVTPGMPFGYYIFVNEQPNRNAAPTMYADDEGEKVVPDYNPDLDNPNTLETEAAAIVPRPADEVLFAGYKDYKTLLDIMGQFIQHHSDLARLRGMRQSGSDLTKGRNALSMIQRDVATDYCVLRGMFAKRQNPDGSPVEFPPGDASGVYGALFGVEIALGDITNVRSFLNGETNVIGLDPNFLLLVQAASVGGTQYDTFNILAGVQQGIDDDTVTIPGRLLGSAQPLGAALAKRDEAVLRYGNFRASVDQVVKELDDLNSGFGERFTEITGYALVDSEAGDPLPNPAWDGINPKLEPNPPNDPILRGELGAVNREIANLIKRRTLLGQATLQLLDDIKKANEAVKIAEAIDDEIESAKQEYLNEVSDAWTEIHSWAGAAAGAQAAFDAATAGADLVSKAAAAIAGAINTPIQTAAATRSSMRDEEKEKAAVGMETRLAKAELPLVVQQAKMEVGALLREAYSNKIEIEDNLTALAQAIGQRTELLREVERAQENLTSDIRSVRTKFYADPIHYVLAENALIEADAAFRNAQRWVFYTLRALEYKWQLKFASVEGLRKWDSGSIFKMRNAKELEDLVIQMIKFDANVGAAGARNDPGSETAFVSLRDHVLAPDPGALSKTADSSDNDIRIDLESGQAVSKGELFRRKLNDRMTSSGAIEMTFSTAALQNFEGLLFLGPTYEHDENTGISSIAGVGKWRDKIDYIKVNIVAKDGTTTPATKLGQLTYAGNTFFRTRVPLLPNRSTGSNDPLGVPETGEDANDLGGEFTMAPFRYYRSLNYNNVFEELDFQTSGLNIAYTGDTARSPTGEEILASTFQNNAFRERSVAATRWKLRINGAENFVDQIEDIEFIIRHSFYGREFPTP